MNRARLLAIGKLGLLLGVPVGLILTLFGAGVYCGVSHRAAITGFEHDVLGLDVEVVRDDPPASPAAPTPPASPTATPTTTTTPSTTTPATTTPSTTSPSTTPTPPATTPSTPPVTPTVTPPATTPSTPPVVDTPTTQVDPLPSNLGDRMNVAARVRVKVLVDDALTKERADWIDYVQRTVSRASQIYEQQFNITIELYGVGRWPVATEGHSADQLLEDLRARSRDGADILIGMTARPVDGSISGEAETPTPESAFNGAHGIVYSVPGMTEPHLRTLLHEVAHMFGALDVTDSSDAAWQGGSWMSYAPVRDGQTPWIDPQNRKRVLERKDKPFAPEPAPAAQPSAPNPEL